MNQRDLDRDGETGLLILLVLIMVAILVSALFMARPARARDLDGQYAQNASPLHDWFKAQRSRQGAVCCDESDGRLADDWGRTSQGSYWVETGGQRLEVPQLAVVEGVNRMGEAIVWMLPSQPGIVRCFMPGAET